MKKSKPNIIISKAGPLFNHFPLSVDFLSDLDERIKMDMPPQNIHIEQQIINMNSIVFHSFGITILHN